MTTDPLMLRTRRMMSARLSPTGMMSVTSTSPAGVSDHVTGVKVFGMYRRVGGDGVMAVHR